MQRFRTALALSALLLCAVVSAACPSTAQALQPPRPGELERLAEEGRLDEAVAQARSYGNDRVAPELLQRLAPERFEGDLIGQWSELQALSDPEWPLMWGHMPSEGVVKVPVVLIDFTDYPAALSTAQLNSMLSGTGDPDLFPTESLRNYYLRSSYGQLDIRPQVVGIYHYPGPRSQVTDERALVQEAFSYFDQLGHDYTQYDSNADGYIDYEIVFWAGPTGEWASFWWGHYGETGDYNFLLDGKRLRPWSWQWTPSADHLTASTVIHETGHALGLQDLYDYDSSVGPDGGVGVWDPMECNTGDHNAVSKWMLGWLTPSIVSSGSSSTELRPAGLCPDALIAGPGYSTADPFREFFMVAARNRSGNDDVDWLYPTDTRLQVWHFDATLDSTGLWFEYDNSYASHKFARIMEADGLEEIEAGVLDTSPVWIDLYAPGQSFTPTTFPNSRFYTGLDSGVSITNIARSGANLTFTAAIGSTGVGDGNDEIPGVPLPASPALGALDYSADHDDVYSVYLQAGQTFTAALTGPAATDFDTRLYPPGTLSIASGTSVASATGVTYPDSLSYTPATSGTYYLRAYAYAGSGAYSITHNAAAVIDDDDIPGVTAPASPISGSVDKASDGSDVYAFALQAGQTLSASLTGPAGTDFDMGLFAPGSASISTGEQVAWATSTAYPDRFTYAVSTSGTYYLRVYPWSGGGSYTVTYSISDGSVVRPQGMERIAGSTRYATSAEVSERGFPAGSDTVILATGQNWPDALGGAALSGVYDAPVLLTQRDYVPDPVANELQRLDPSRIIILGGSGAVSEYVDWELWSLLPGVTIERCEGSDRHATSREIAQRVVEDSAAFDGTAFVSTGLSFPDALAAAPLSAAFEWPLYLSGPGGLPQATLLAMQAAGVNEVVILGGTSAVPGIVEWQLSDAGISATRLAGSNRYETALQVAQFGVDEGLSWDGSGIAAGVSFPDALSGGAMLGRCRSVMLLTPQAYLYGGVYDALNDVRGELGGMFIVGGTGAVSQYAEDDACWAAGFY